MTQPTRQARHHAKRRERGAVHVSVVLDPALEPDLVKLWNGLKADHGGQKPALLELLLHWRGA